jgi:hypothetical protein
MFCRYQGVQSTRMVAGAEEKKEEGEEGRREVDFFVHRV